MDMEGVHTTTQKKKKKLKSVLFIFSKSLFLFLTINLIGIRLISNFNHETISRLDGVILSFWILKSQNWLEKPEKKNVKMTLRQNSIYARNQEIILSTSLI